ncbi:30S ribosomal protein S14 [Nonomuraea sp. JJY05]|uniref:30S ribosomal protein S14 n=1 Tax=Nonomuraea sp. JJY05 TaxID=3350255 RepID=UPI00373F18D5
MAKKSKIAANERRKTVVQRYAARRAELKEIIRTGTPQERAEAFRAPLREQEGGQHRAEGTAELIAQGEQAYGGSPVLVRHDFADTGRVPGHRRSGGEHRERHGRRDDRRPRRGQW